MKEAQPRGTVRDERLLIGPESLRRRSIPNATPDAPMPATKEAVTAARRPRPPYLGITSALVVFFFTCIFYFRGTLLQGIFTDHQQHPTAQEVKTPASHELDYILHPEAHIHRPPATFHHEWVITESPRRPDGVLKPVYTINGQFPGPVLEARSGDTLIINVANNITTRSNGISIHWHGLHMLGQNAYDGAVGFTQSPIASGTNFTYHITIAAEQWGTFWYHAHDQVQRADGLFGGFIVHRPVEHTADGVREYDGLEERLLLVGDWYHRPAEDVLAWYMRAGSFGNEPVPDSMLVNGRGAYNCSMAVRARPVDCEARVVPGMSLDFSRKYRLRVINHGSLSGFTVGTNAGSFRAVEVDGGSEIAVHEPASSVGVVYPGQRCDLILDPSSSSTTDGKAPFLSISFDRENFKYPNPALTDTQQFPIDMQGPSVSPHHSTASDAASNLKHFDLNTASAANPSALSLPEEADLTMVLYTTTQKLSHLHNIPHGFMNQTTWKAQANPPAPLINLPREQWDKNQFVPRIDSKTAPWVDLVINNLDDGSHPFHLHGYDVYVLSSYSADRGWGSYNPFDKSVPAPGGAFNLLNPVKRDTFWVPRRGYTVVRFRADNPGIWMFHCHLLWHQASGMAMGFEVY